MVHPGRSLAFASATLALLGLAFQLADPTPPVLTGSDKSMEQYEAFREHVAIDGPHDLIVFGNSVARQGIDGRRIEARLGAEAGRRFRAYNFASGGTPPPGLCYMVGLAYGIDRPRLAVIGVTPRYAASWAPHAEARARTLLASPYGRAIGDPVHWRGRAGRWLLDHVAVFGLRYAWKDALLGRPPASREPGRYDPRRGFRDVERRAERAPREPVTDWEITEAKKAVLAGAVECLRRRGAEVFLAQTPVHPEAIASFPSGPGGLGEVPGVIADVARRSGAHALLLPGSLRFGQGEFRDSVHLNAAGAARYSDWLAQELEQAVGPRG